MNDQETIEELPDIEEFDRIGRSNLQTDEERATWCVRPGVSFQGIEIFLGERVFAIPLDAIRKRRQQNQLEMYVLRIMADMRSRRTLVKCNECGSSREYYRRLDVVHEVHHALWEAISRHGRLQLGICQGVADYTKEIKFMQDYIDGCCIAAEKGEVLLDKSIDTLKVNGWVLKALRDAGIKTIREICSMTKEQVQEIPNMGVRTFSSLRDEFERLHLKFGQEKECLESAETK